MSYIKFRDSYGTVKNNFLTVLILDNKNFFYKQGRVRKNFDSEFFQIPEGMVPDLAVLKLKWADFCDANWNFLAYEDILERVRIDLDRERVRKLSSGFQNARKKLFNKNDNIAPVPEFFGTFKKGSRSFRTALCRSKLIPKIKNCPIKKFAVTVNTDCLEPEIVRKIN
jgi:hypothetical protein